ncbi:MAG: dihydrodipicolinate synthase family protein [Spirochaetia bacterium]|jgi:4-hydroxy-tetrahydrodipicolinate synthase|nr:dihydrodipicolinate synthase family protein [Spirochaetia bacterium]
MENNRKAEVWPTMVTPFKEDLSIDYAALEKLVEWYIERGVSGLFAVCQSSEMHQLSLRERVELSSAVLKLSAGRVPVISSGHISSSSPDQIEEIKAIADTGVDAVILVTNLLAGEAEPDSVWQKRMEVILSSIPGDINLGLYECPFPYKRLLSNELIDWIISTDRFAYLKDTCCDLDTIKKRAEMSSGSNLKLYNANAASLLGSLRVGYSGYCGIMTNFHPELYVKLCENWSDATNEIENLQNFIGLASVIEYQYYPVNAKYLLQLEGLGFTLKSRKQNYLGLNSSMKMEVEQMRNLTCYYKF